MSTSNVSLTERMQKLRETNDFNSRSELHAYPTHIYVLLELYNKAPYECYINYMEGFKLLVDWLCPTSKQLLLGIVLKLPKVPALAKGYSQNEVTKIICAKKGVTYSHSEYLASMNELEAVIYYHGCVRPVKAGI